MSAPASKPEARAGTPSASSRTATTSGVRSRSRSSPATRPTSARPTCTRRRPARRAARRARTSAAGSTSCAGSRRPPRARACRSTRSGAPPTPIRFPSMMGRVCPAPCQTGCNRNKVEDTVGINAVEQYIGDYALEQNFAFQAGPETGKRVADRGRRPGGPVGGLSAAPQRPRGHPVRRSRRAGRHGEVRRAGLPPAAHAPGRRDRPHHRDGRRGPAQHAHRQGRRS